MLTALNLYKKPLVLDLLYYGTGIILPGLFSFLFIPFVVNLYGASSYAEYTLAYNTLNVVSMFCYGWIGQSYIRFYSSFPGSFLNHSITFLRNSLFIGFVFFIAFQILFAHTSLPNILFFIPAFFLSGYYNFSLIASQAHQQAKKVALLELLRTLINFTLPLFLYSLFGNHLAIEILALSLLLSYLIPLIIYFRKKVNKSEQSFFHDSIASKKEIKKEVLSYGIPVAFFLSLSVALSVNDRFIIARLINYDDAGHYSSIYDILNRGVTLSCAAVLMTFYPHITRLYNNGNKKLAFKNIKRAVAVELFLFVAGLVLILFFGVDLWNLFFKQKITNDDLVILLLIYCGVFIWQFCILLHKPLELRKKTWLMAIGVAIALVFNSIANIILLQMFQTLLVPAVTTLLASLVYGLFIVICLLFRKND